MRHLSLAEISHLVNRTDTASSLIPKGFSVDSRTLKSGEIYIALKGATVDGHDFLEQAKEQGAVAALVSQDYNGPNFGLILIYVPDPLSAVQHLAKEILKRKPLRIAAITGSLGKTTTKEFLRTLLSKKYRMGASPGNNNSQIGIPLTILNHTDGSEELLVLEMGMTVPGNITGLVRIAAPELAIITTVALVHACNFESIDEIARAKAEIFSHPKTKQVILHRDIANYDELVQQGSCKKVSFSKDHPQADYTIEVKDDFLYVTEKGEIHSLGPFTLPGKHNHHNLLAAVAGARYFGLSWDEIRSSIPELTLLERRLQLVEHKGIFFLNDAYNAAELSVKSALETLPEPKNSGSKIAVLGSMMELGKFSDDCHRRVGEHALKYVEKVFCLGKECQPIYDLWKKEGRPIEIHDDLESLVKSLRGAIRPADVVLLKGSRSKKLWKVIEEL